MKNRGMGTKPLRQINPPSTRLVQGNSLYISIPSDRCGKRCCKHHIRWRLPDWEGKPMWCAKYGEPAQATGARPRGKSYPYSSFKQILKVSYGYHRI